jgi:hypothetical protein
MAQVAGTTDTYDQAGLREELHDVISNISPMDRPFTSNIDQVSGKARYTEWLKDSLAAAALNAQIEGDDASYTTAVTVTRLGNYQQIFRKSFIVSGTLDAVDKAGRKSEVKYQLMKAGKELMRDIEFAALGMQQSSAGGSGTARRIMGGAASWIPTTDNSGNGERMSAGSTAAFASGITGTVTAGTNVTLTSTALLNALGYAWDDGGETDTILTGKFNRKIIRTFGNLATNQIQLNKSGEAAKLIDSVEVYVTDFGKHKLVLSRFQDEENVFCFDMKTWAMSYLRPVMTETLAKTGDAEKRMLIAEATLVCRNPDANAKVQDCATA